ncbi:MAG: type II toxin-antitoxin system HicA family toxin [Cyanobacteriota bacterium]
MGFRRKQLTCKDVKKILKSLGFSHDRTEGSHEQWVGYKNGRKILVTVDCPKAPFDAWLLKAMVRQSGYSKDEWYKQLEK